MSGDGRAIRSIWTGTNLPRRVIQYGDYDRLEQTVYEDWLFGRAIPYASANPLSITLAVSSRMTLTETSRITLIEQ